MKDRLQRALQGVGNAAAQRRITTEAQRTGKAA